MWALVIGPPRAASRRASQLVRRWSYLLAHPNLASIINNLDLGHGAPLQQDLIGTAQARTENVDRTVAQSDEPNDVGRIDAACLLRGPEGDFLFARALRTRKRLPKSGSVVSRFARRFGPTTVTMLAAVHGSRPYDSLN